MNSSFKKVLFALLVAVALVPSTYANGSRTPKLLYASVLPLPDNHLLLYGKMLLLDVDDAVAMAHKPIGLFFKHRAKGLPLTVEFGSQSTRVTTDEVGDFSASVPLEAFGESPVQYRFTLTSPASYPGVVETATGPIPVMPQMLIVSDIDDTVLKTDVPEKFEAFLHTFLFRNKWRRPVVGTPAIYRELVRGTNQVPNGLIFLSGSPVYLAPRLEEFFAMNAFPPHALMCNEVSPADLFFGGTWTGHGQNAQLHKKTQEFKLEQMAKLAKMYPGTPMVFFGDSGQLDPETFLQFAKACPDVLKLAVIHNITQQDTNNPRYAELRKLVPCVAWSDPQVLRAALASAKLIIADAQPAPNCGQSQGTQQTPVPQAKPTPAAPTHHWWNWLH